MADRITIQDIADSLGISRNTVSKAINNAPGLAEATRERILQKAAEMGYKQFSYINQVKQAQRSQEEGTALGLDDGAWNASTQTKEIAFFSTTFLGGSHFAIAMLDQFQLELSRRGYSLTLHRISPQELAERRLPLTFQRSRTSGIICAELFDADYVEMLSALGLPLVLTDSPVLDGSRRIQADRLMMDNTDCILSFLRRMAESGKKEFGFIGNATHCHSFFERYLAFRMGMVMLGLPIREEFCLTETYQEKEYPTTAEYQSYLREHIHGLEHLPDVFLCSNDFVAIDAIHAMRRQGLSVPEDVLVCGFDDSPESRFFTPSLTSMHINSKDMGLCAVDLLMSRMKNPKLARRTVYVSTEVVYRESAPLR